MIDVRAMTLSLPIFERQESEWDDALLSLELQELDGDGSDLELTGFDLGELSALVSPTEGRTNEDDAPAAGR